MKKVLLLEYSVQNKDDLFPTIDFAVFENMNDMYTFIDRLNKKYNTVEYKQIMTPYYSEYELVDKEG